MANVLMITCDKPNSSTSCNIPSPLNTGALGGNAKYAPHAFTESDCIEGKTRRQPKYRPHRYDRKKSQS